MAKSLSSILSQIERLQKEAATIQSEVIARIRRDIAKFGLTAEQLFGASGVAKPGRAAKAAVKQVKAAKPPKYADGAGNSWGDIGKRPEWIRQALAAGRALEDFLIAKGETPPRAKAKPTKSRAKPKAAATPKPAAKKRTAAKSATPRKPRKPRTTPPAQA